MIGKALIIGGGVGGMSAALALARRGVEVELADADPHWRAYGAGISVTGLSLRAFDDLGILDEVREKGSVGAGMRLRAVDGSVIMETPTPPPDAPPIARSGGIMRPALHEIMSNRVRNAGVRVTLGAEVTDLAQDDDGVDVAFPNGRSERFDLVVGADGIFSKTRQALFPGAPTPKFTGQGCWRIVADRPAQVDRAEMWLGGPVKLGFNPVSRDKMYAFILEHVPDNPWFEPEAQLPHVAELLQPYGGYVATIRENLGEDSLVNYRPLEWVMLPPPWHKGRVVMIGDAVHATTPHMASGAGMAVEDGLVLAEELANHDDIEEALSAFTARRFERARMVVENSVRIGEIEMAGGDQRDANAMLGDTMHKLQQPLLKAIPRMTYGLATVSVDGAPQAVLFKDDKFVPLCHWGEARDLPSLLADWERVGANLAQWASDDSAFASAADFAAADVRAPYRPGQVFCTGANYKKHVVGLIMGDPSMRTAEHENLSDEERKRQVEEMMDQRAKALPFVFLKLPSCVVGPRDDVILPRNVEKPDWELELGVVIGKRAHHVGAADAMDYVAGFAVVNDVTAREHIFRRDGSAIGADWLSGKCFPTFLPFGPMIVPKAQVADPYDLTITLKVNGKTYQNESTSDMMASIERQIAYLSDRVVLEPGDLICTGSPYGNGSAFGVFLKPGDVMEGTISGLGTQRNRCVAEA